MSGPHDNDTPDETAGDATQDPPVRPPIDRRMLEALVCPVTHAPLRYDIARQELVSRAAHLAFPIRNGIPIMLASEARDAE